MTISMISPGLIFDNALGYTLVSLVAVLIAANLAYVAAMSILSIVRKIKIYNLKKEAKKRLKQIQVRKTEENQGRLELFHNAKVYSL